MAIFNSGNTFLAEWVDGKLIIHTPNDGDTAGSIQIGIAGDGIDLKAFGATNHKYLLFDASDDSFNLVGITMESDADFTLTTSDGNSIIFDESDNSMTVGSGIDFVFNGETSVSGVVSDTLTWDSSQDALVFSDANSAVDTSTTVSGTVEGTLGYIKVIIGSSTRYIKLYDTVS